VDRFFLGVDGGQSSTTAVIGDATGRVIGEGHAGPCNHVSTEEAAARFTQAIAGAAQAALAAAGLARDTRFAAACLGLSGGPADKERLARKLISAGRYSITTDAHVALAGALAGEPGVIVISGTGSIALGRNAQGRTARAGGWGYIFGDEGSAFDIVRQAVRAALRNEEGWGPATALRDAFLAAGDAPDVNTLLHRFYTPEFPRARVASFARLVDGAARDGDAIARDILHSAAQHLALFARAVRAQLFAETEPAAVAYIGGTFNSTLVLERFRMLVELDGASAVQPPKYEPAAGALLEAYRLAGVVVELSRAVTPPSPAA
jgi:N-acetylglucosamine kinase-like BadF-type ATPase